MCDICANLRPFDKSCDLAGLGGTTVDSLRATIREGSDASDWSDSFHRMAVGDVFLGNVEQVGDQDWVGVRLQAGQTYNLTLNGLSLSDPVLEIRDARGLLLAVNDDANASLDSQIIFRPTESGVYFVTASGYGWHTGTYQMTVETIAPPTAAPLSVLADYLVEGFWNDIGQSERAFDTIADNVITVDLSALGTMARGLARDAMAAWSSVANLQFVERTGSVDITFSENDEGAYSTSTTSGGQILSSHINVDVNWLLQDGGRIGTYSFQAYMHEIGHALGLGHQGYYNGHADFGIDSLFINDSWRTTVMSYFSQTDNPWSGASLAYLGTLMPVDIIAIQRLYGAPDAGSLTAGNTVYGQGHTLGDSWLGRIFSAQTGGAVPTTDNARAIAITISDTSGWDVLNFAHDRSNQRIDMRMGTASDIFGLRGNLQIAEGTVIEEYRAGFGHDRVLGNGFANVIYGGNGNDTLQGGSGNDRLFGGAGQDRLVSLTGNNRLFGGDGNDRLESGTGADRLHGGNGDDVLFAGAGNDSLSGGDGNDHLSGGDGADRIFGGLGNDHLEGGNDNDTLIGGIGRDTILGGAGADRLEGSLGDDRLFGGLGNDVLMGQGGNDLLKGEAGADRLFGGAGADTLVGGSGTDIMEGGAGADVFRFFAAAESGVRNPDLIRDFRPGEDRIDLQALDLNYYGGDAPGGSRSLRWDHSGTNTQIFIDLDGDRQADMVISLEGRLMLSEDSFIL
ncbi:M10 family metallopeptidase C-terminal domain-containing protein [Paracoccus sp. (in: a-proteobacteria)]|uniref:M10 family metallopeptidase C-terminal domain-containing protein n=1 Tax=Paracoccus sp. TaxID=267 RepID=UPI00396C3248